MNYNEQQLREVEQYAAIYLPIRDMAVLMELPAEVLRTDIAQRTSAVSKAYYRGKASSKLKLREQEMALAQVGSPLALESTHRNLLDMEDDE
jgi:hypothetical protein